MNKEMPNKQTKEPRSLMCRISSLSCDAECLLNNREVVRDKILVILNRINDSNQQVNFSSEAARKTLATIIALEL